ncbi:Rotatin [Mytilus edulis]|uniref:Rotatin n=1 Tax=Mytilus edulis TaxID=6550 RepID=A0A8S3UUX8_MYTED|nr:Rotatin [Mytilus edulis]
MDRKQPMFELPFSNIRNAAFVSVLETNHSVKVELKRVKEKLKEKNINGEKIKDQHNMKDEEISNLKEQLHTMWERAQLYVKQNEEFREELDKFKSTPENLNINDLYWQNEFLRTENLRIITVSNDFKKQQYLEKSKIDVEYNEIVKRHPIDLELQLDYDQLQKTLDLCKESTMGRKEEREKYEIKIVQLEMQIRQFQQQQQNQQQPQQQMWNQPQNVYNQRQSFNSNYNSHDLEEIRIRALENLLSKLEHKLICDADLIHERHLLIRIVEWFNFPNSSSNADVLKLLLRLTQHSPAAEILQDIGGIEFLSQLRKDVSSSLQPLVDQILENTMRLPEIKHQDHAPECIYQKQENQTGFKAETTTDTLQSSLPPVNQDTPYIAGTRDDNVGYFNRDAIESVQQQQQYQQNNETASSFVLTTFPWLALTSTDRHVILSTNSSLQSRESHLLASSCEFLSDVVFRDFPSEIFLQRPNIVKVINN